MSRLPLVSIVIPTYGHRDYILRTLESVFVQTFTDYEVIVVNDGSPDDTEGLLQPLVSSGRISYIAQPNEGVAAARNRGIAQAGGEFIALLDDDDLWPADKLERQVKALRDAPNAVLVYGGVTLIGSDDSPLTTGQQAALSLEVPPNGPSGEVFAAFAQRNFILSPGQTLIRHSALDRLQEPPFDTLLWGCDDYDLWLRLAEIGPFIYSQETALHYRVHLTNASRNEAKMHLNEMALYRKHLHRQQGNPTQQVLVKRGMRERRIRLAKYWLRQGRLRTFWNILTACLIGQG